MKRRRISLVSVVSVLCVASMAALGAENIWPRRVGIAWVSPGRVYSAEVYSEYGELTFWCGKATLRTNRFYPAGLSAVPAGQGYPGAYIQRPWRLAGICYWGPAANGVYLYAVSVPYLWVTVLTLPALCARVITARRRRRAAAIGKCVNCGYDLRATPDRCPECGAVPTTAR
ncbi:MAG TPA: hypothetical protein VG269_03325 [Tepidisphaeraceae bacterium]|jgi:hypothetical protein|nr:hypothetical protein [Tepidisphaeraceae bacterium]